METRQWWANIDDMFGFAARAAKKHKGNSITASYRSLNDKNSTIIIEADRKGFEKGSYDFISFETEFPFGKKVDSEKLIRNALDSFGGYNIYFSASKLHNNEIKGLEMEIRKADWIECIFPYTSVALDCSISADGEVTKDDLRHYKDIAMLLGASVELGDSETEFSIAGQMKIPYGMIAFDRGKIWQPVDAFNAAYGRGMDVEINSWKKDTEICLKFGKYGLERIAGSISARKNLIFGVNKGQADAMYRLFSGVSEFCAREWIVEPHIEKKATYETPEPKLKIKVNA
ncbi:MAG: hypothetical protein PHO02_03400 [Candidatus Nanoarchaeia archaeon]|nr:hypothetical protein [Candidatus Nanoarchaeia archaeon]